jgi:hypothetical protein
MGTLLLEFFYFLFLCIVEKSYLHLIVLSQNKHVKKYNQTIFFSKAHTTFSNVNSTFISRQNT